MFRVNGSSKFGSNRVLKHPSVWYDTLVQYGSYEVVYECLEIDGSEPISNSKSPFELFSFENGVWVALHKLKQHSCASIQVPNMLSPLLNKIDSLCDHNLYRHKMSMTATGSIFCSTKSKKCAIAKRCHKGNNIWFEIDLIGQRVFQHCYDSECKGKRHEVNGLEQYWQQWNNCWSQTQPDSMWCPESLSAKNENTLYLSLIHI